MQVVLYYLMGKLSFSILSIYCVVNVSTPTCVRYFHEQCNLHRLRAVSMSFAICSWDWMVLVNLHEYYVPPRKVAGNELGKIYFHDMRKPIKLLNKHDQTLKYWLGDYKNIIILPMSDKQYTSNYKKIIILESYFILLI